jgi:hypothetical protein
MSIDIYSLIDNLEVILTSCLLAFAAVRALQMRRGLISSIYRSRAFWSAGFLAVIVFNNIAGYVPVPDSIIGGIFFFLPFFLLLIAILAYVDRTVLVAIETDFFHRDILRWKRLRIGAFPLLLLSMVIFVVDAFLSPPNSQGAPGFGDPVLLIIGFYQLFVVFVAVFGYSVAALVIGVRRTPDATLKRHIRFLAMALGIFIVVFLVSGITSGAVPFDLFTDILGFVSSYMLYLSVMSLSPIGRIERIGGVSTSSISNGQTKMGNRAVHLTV